MRPRALVVGSVLTAILVLVALPGLAGSRTTRPIEPVPAGAFTSIADPAPRSGAPVDVAGLAPEDAADGLVSHEDVFIEPGTAPKTGPLRRARVDQPESAATRVRKPAKYTLKGEATFYDEGTTAMRLPYGTTVIICGGGGCVERVVRDYGPQKESRIVDLHRPDFFKICGCPSWSGVTEVTVYVY